MKNMKVLVLALLAGFDLSLAWAAELSGTPEDLSNYLATAPGRITIVGEGEVIIPADEMKLNFAVKTKEGTLQAALRQNQGLRKQIMDYLAAQGIKSEHILSEKFSSTPRYGMFGDRPKSYEVVNKLTITVKSEAEFIAVSSISEKWTEVLFLDAVAKQSAQDVHKRSALQKALDNAMAKKALYEQSLGIKLRLQRVEEHSIAPLPRAPLQARRKFETGSMVESMAPEPMLAEGDSGAGSFGQFVYQALVQIEFVIEKK